MGYLNNHANRKRIVEIIPYCHAEEAELDEMWSFVQKKKNQRWLWLAIQSFGKHNMLHNSDIMLSYIYDGEEQINKLKKNIEYFCDFITNDIRNFANIKYNDDKDINNVQKRIELYKKSVALYELMYEDRNYGFYNDRLWNLYLDITLNYIILNDSENALDCLEKAAEHTIVFDTLPKVFIYTSMVFNGTEFSYAYRKHSYNLSYKILYTRLSDEKFNPIRENERFKAVVAKLEQYASKEI